MTLEKEKVLDVLSSMTAKMMTKLIVVMTDDEFNTFIEMAKKLRSVQ